MDKPCPHGVPAPPFLTSSPGAGARTGLCTAARGCGPTGQLRAGTPWLRATPKAELGLQELLWGVGTGEEAVGEQGMRVSQAAALGTSVGQSVLWLLLKLNWLRFSFLLIWAVKGKISLWGKN